MFNELSSHSENRTEGKSRVRGPEGKDRVRGASRPVENFSGLFQNFKADSIIIKRVDISLSIVIYVLIIVRKIVS